MTASELNTSHSSHFPELIHAARVLSHFGQTLFLLAKCTAAIGVLLPQDPYFATPASIV